MTTIAEAHARLVREAAIQLRFEHAPVAPPLPDPPPLGGWSLPDGGALFWPLMGVIGVVVLVVLVQVVRGRGFRRRAAAALPKAAVVAAADAMVVAPKARDAEALAQAGAYGEAIHALLLRCIEAIPARFPRALLPAHTSRDIAGLEALPEPWRAGFAALARPVEGAVFAGRAPGQAEWEACRSQAAALLAWQ